MSGLSALGTGEGQTGFLLGVISVLLVIFLLFIIRVWWRAFRAMFSPQRIVQMTKRTPWDVVTEGIFNFLLMVLVVLVVAVGISYLVG